ncbi:major facilitator superfamily domain-containing protein [Fusarium solani]|uniref:Major facilitator superfamily domain-containing protein n=1 Tax=Fusarium solani TaxID=169388 RepID=A0A9P9L615_FUSSL|nr:major facilitator superfamily domain-containing protein [Fusarium solani]KAH7274874.1 major facilitator superfamily domain-containing protein [Fusarium solani]
MECIPFAQRWNGSRENTFRTLSSYFAFTIYGMNDGTPGAIVPHLESYYSLPYSIVSLIFLAPMLGCITAAFTSNRLHQKFGRRGVAALATGSYAISYAGMCAHPPFGLVVPLLVLTGFGSGLMNGTWNSWVGGLANGGTMLAFLHGCWGAGATIAPITVNAFVSRGWNWWAYYYNNSNITNNYLTISKSGLAIAAAATTVWSFWADCGTSRSTSASGQAHSFTFSVFKDKVTLLFSAFMLLYVGAEITIGGWLVTFMLNVRNGTPSASSLVASGFWIGITVGRFALGWITSYFGEKIMVSAYLVVAIGLELAFWLGKEFVVSAIMAALVGLSIGMVMPASIRMMTKILPVEKHIVSVGFGTAFAISGASIFPFAVGALAQAGGVQVLQPVILALFAVQLLLWLFVTRMKLDRDEDSSA